MKVTKDMLTARFQMKDLGNLRHFLGIDFDQSDNCLTGHNQSMLVKSWNGSTCRILSLDQHLVNRN